MRRLSPYWAPISYQISEKSLEWFLRYAVTYGCTYWTDSIGPAVFNLGPISDFIVFKKNIIKFFLLLKTMENDDKFALGHRYCWPKFVNKGQHLYFTVGKMVLCNRYHFLAHLGKIYTKYLERFIRKVWKPRKWRQIRIWTCFCFVIRKMQIFTSWL